MIIFMRGTHGKEKQTNQNSAQAKDLQNNLNTLKEQNEHLAREIESLKRTQ